MMQAESSRARPLLSGAYRRVGEWIPIITTICIPIMVPIYSLPHFPLSTSRAREEIDSFPYIGEANIL